MPYFDNDPFPGTDYSQYFTWNKVVTPDGQVMYEVPNNPGYVFDPILSNATGKKMFRQNPKRQIDEENRRKDFEDEQRKQQEYLNSPLGQLVPVVGSVGGMVAANQLLTPSATTALANAAAGGATGAGALGTTAGTTAGLGGGMSAGAGTTATTAGTTGGAGLGVGGSLGTAGTLGIGAAAALAAAHLYNQGGKEVISGKGKTEDYVDLGVSANPMTFWVNPVLDVFGMDSVGNMLSHKSTRERQADVTNDIMNKYKDDPQAQAYWSAMREQFKDAPPDPSKPFLNGTYGSWDEYKQAGLQAGDLSGVGGNAIFNEWASLSQPQREAVTQALIDADLYDSKDGGVVIKDEKKAQEIKNNVLKGFNVGANATAAAQGAMGV